MQSRLHYRHHDVSFLSQIFTGSLTWPLWGILADRLSVEAPWSILRLLLPLHTASLTSPPPRCLSLWVNTWPIPHLGHISSAGKHFAEDPSDTRHWRESDCLNFEALKVVKCACWGSFSAHTAETSIMCNNQVQASKMQRLRFRNCTI